jgi:2-beta-glucuronyltransferase
MKRAVLLTGHFPEQRRKGSLLWLSEGLRDRGWHVTHATLGYSWLSVLRGDQRLTGLDRPPVQGLTRLAPDHDALFALSPLHPFGTGTPLFDRLTRPLAGHLTRFWMPRLRGSLSRADLVIVESGPQVVLAPRLRRAAPGARLVYRINDDLRLMRLPDWLPAVEQANLSCFDRISTASPELAARYAHPAITIDPMGIPLDRVAARHPDPFPDRARFEAVCAGTTLIDLPALLRIAGERPDWRLHVLGRLRGRPADLPRNLILHGEQPYDRALAHVAHADIGLAPYHDRPGVEYQRRSSNRMLLYRHFGLPILGPDRLCHADLPSVVGYGDPDVWHKCETMPRRPERVPDWSELTARILA